MKPIEELLRNLARPDVLEFGLVTNRLPSVNVGGRFEPVDDEAPTTPKLLEMLVTMGGGRFVDGLSDKPVQWTTRLDGVGVIAVAAIMRKDVIQARFTVARRDASLRPSAPSVPAAPVRVPEPPHPPLPPPPPPRRREAERPPRAEWEEEDDEPTVQTLSPGGAPSSSSMPARPRPPTPVPPAPEEKTEERKLPEKPAPAPPAAAEEDVEVTTSEISDETIAEAIESAAAAQAHSAIPSTAPSAAGLPKERPRVDASASLEAFLAMARSSNAADLHLVAGRPVLLRVGLELVPHTQPVAAEHVDRIVRDVVPPRLRTALESDGSCLLALEHPEHGRFRVHVSRQRTGLQISLRAVARELPSIRSLALPDDVAAAAQLPRGLVLVAGPPGHGKSTTLAALVDAVNADDPRYVVTVEDPIELVHAQRRCFVVQREIGAHTRSWADAVSEAIGSEADVVVIGDVRDRHAARALLSACDAGCLVLATIRAPGAGKARDRLVSLVPEDERAAARRTLARTVRTIIGQTLVPSADRGRPRVSFEVLATSEGRG